MENILVIPDSHAHPEYDNDRALALGKMILELRPTTVVHLGDLADMPSLSSYDKGTKGFEGRRYVNDCEAAVDFQEKLWKPVNSYNKQRARNKKIQYKPKRILTKGNHEARIDKAVNNSAELFGVLNSTRDLHFDRHWDIVVPFKKVINVSGFAVCHYMPSGVNGNPVSGKNLAAQLINNGHCSTIVGHNHTRDDAERTTFLGKKLQAIVAGCFVHPGMIDQPEAWAVNTAAMWWNGVVVLNNVEDGRAGSIQFINHDEIIRKYGGN